MNNSDSTLRDTAAIHWSRSARITLALLLFIYLGHRPATGAVLKVPGDYATVQGAIDAAQPGDMVKLGPGRFNESVLTKRGGTASMPIVLDGANTASIRQLILRHPHFHMINMSLYGQTKMYERYVYFDAGAHFCVLSNNIINLDGSGSVYGIEWRFPRIKPFGAGEVASDNLIISNTLKNCSAFIIMSIAGDRNLIIGNRLIDSPNADLFRLFGRSNVLRGNFCANSPYVEGLGNHPDFIQTFGNNGDGSMGHVIEGNIVMQLKGQQITQLEGNLIPETGNWLFRNNLFVDIGLQASCTIPNVKYYNNTFVRCNVSNGGHALTFSSRVYSTSSVYAGISGTNHAHGAEVVNNVFIDCGNSNPNRGWYSFTTNLTGIRANYNLVAKNEYAKVREDVLRRSVGSPQGWSTFDWWEPNGVNGGDPLFRNPQLGDYRLLPGSPIASTGISLATVLFDFDGIRRSQGAVCSMGAFEPPQGGVVPRPSVVRNLRIVEP